MSKMTGDSLLDVANEIFYSVTKNANFILLETARQALTRAPNATRKSFRIKTNLLLF